MDSVVRSQHPIRNPIRLNQMRRRLFLLGGPALLLASRPKPALAVTIDDVAWRTIPEPWRSRAADTLLATLDQYGVRAMLFVAGTNVDDTDGKALLQRWNDAGHYLANHTYEHRRFGRANSAMPWFGEDILRCDELLRNYSRFRKLFRFPTLHEGDTGEQRDAMRSFLGKHAYRNGRVTIDTSDWYYDLRLRHRLQSMGRFDVMRYRRPYVAHILDRGRHYDEVSRQVLGRSVRHTLLIHYNLVNTLFLGDLLQAFRDQGWALIDAEEAFSDTVFDRDPDMLPSGQSLMWMLAKEPGRYRGQLEYPGEWEAKEKPKLDRLGL